MKKKPHYDDSPVPAGFPQSRCGSTARFGKALFDRLYYLRWVSERKQTSLEVLDSRGKTLVRHPLTDSFVLDKRFISVSADWLDARRKRGPMLIACDSDQVRVHVFTDGLAKLLCTQDFNDSSSSISATTVEFGRDKRGIFTVTESYSERGDEEGNPSENNHSTEYHWTGRGFEAGRGGGLRR